MMENRDTQKENIIIPWKHVGPQGASHPFGSFVSTQINRRHSQLTNTKHLRLREMTVANRAVERDNKAVLSIQTKKGSLNSRKYCCFVVYFAKFLGRCTQRKQDIWKWKAENLTLTSSGTERSGDQCFVARRKGLLVERALAQKEGNEGQTAAHSEGTEEAGRMITLPAMATNLLWGDENTWIYPPSSGCLWSRHTVACDTDGCFWPAVHRAEQ